ncbi:MAG: hypothetical protein MZW92_02740 [Comamonadaceae bacterium]|nr:hypothetical protein [Comamonadaceae bacterium]
MSFGIVSCGPDDHGSDFDRRRRSSPSTTTTEPEVQHHDDHRCLTVLAAPENLDVDRQSRHLRMRSTMRPATGSACRRASDDRSANGSSRSGFNLSLIADYGAYDIQIKAIGGGAYADSPSFREGRDRTRRPRRNRHPGGGKLERLHADPLDRQNLV